MTFAAVPVTCRGPDMPPRATTGFVPFAESPLAVTTASRWDAVVKAWEEIPRFQITHRSTGFNLGGREFLTRDEAEAFLTACDPTFAAWPAANGTADDVATIACRVKFRMAIAATTEARK